MNKIRKNNQGSNGYTLLFSVIVAVIVLSIAASILSISRKEYILTTTARDSMVAIYAADSLAECIAGSGMSTSSSSFACGSQTLSLSWSNSAGIYTGTLDSGSYYSLGSGNGCAYVGTITATYASGSHYDMKIYGHSLGDTATLCKTPTNPRVIERGLQLSL